MSRFRVSRRDDAEPAIVRALEQCGCVVHRLDAGTGGLPDLLVMRAGRLFLLEVKSNARALKKRGRVQSKTNERQADFRKRGWPVHVVLSPADALRAVGLVNWQAVVERNADEVERKVAAVMAAHGGGL